MIKLEDVSKYYSSNLSVTCALRKINLEFNVGEFVAIVGESGSGKTTLLNVISGLDTYEEGEMVYNNKSTSFFDNNDWEDYRKNQIAFVFQNYNIINSFTVLENTIMPLLINNYSRKEAIVQAKKLLKLVGLEKFIKTKAIKLSGGQKQRLAIARALAKNTNIIVADEPTGNLDSENGKAIMKLLKMISKDKLVIVVTHNQPQAEPFITRKIRLHEGEVVLDEKKKDNENQEIDSIDLSLPKIENRKAYKKIVNIGLLNIKSQPRRSILLMLMILTSIFAFFIFAGTFSANLDDSKTKEISDELFVNHDQTRLLVKTIEEDVITDDILAKAKTKKVTQVEKYDYITDVNYFRNGDYETIYAGGYVGELETVFIDSSSIYFNNTTHYMRSYFSISQDMLSAGRLPTNNLEMVVYSNDESIIGETETVYFQNRLKWGEDEVIRYDVTITGILKDYTNQAYFSEDLCKMLEFTSNSFSIVLEYSFIKKAIIQTKQLAFSYLTVVKELEGNQVMLPEDNVSIFSIEGFINDTYDLKAGIYSYDYTDVFTYNVTNKLTTSKSALGVSEEFFNKMYDRYVTKKQFAVFIDDYAYTDEVISDLENLDFHVLSCFRSSVTGYNTTKLVQRYVTLAISLASLFFIAFIEIILCNIILKFKKNDYLILKIIGLSNKNSARVNYFEIAVYNIISYIILLITCLIVKNCTKNNNIIEMFKYIRFYHYIIIFVIAFITMYIIGNKFKKFLTQRVKVSQLKED